MSCASVPRARPSPGRMWCCGNLYVCWLWAARPQVLPNTRYSGWRRYPGTNHLVNSVQHLPNARMSRKTTGRGAIVRTKTIGGDYGHAPFGTCDSCERRNSVVLNGNGFQKKKKIENDCVYLDDANDWPFVEDDSCHPHLQLLVLLNTSSSRCDGSATWSC